MPSRVALALILLFIVGAPLLVYGATAPDTIGGINAIASILTVMLGALGFVLALVGLVKKRISNRAALSATIVFFALAAAGVAVLMTRDFQMGYGP